jgi:phospholipid/cholesterol/gamma-HCH transport system permease protein
MTAANTILDFSYYVARSLSATITPPYRGKDILQQLEFVSWQSLPVILFCVSFAAIVTIIESSFHMKLVVQNDALVPGFAALLILRELGAVVSALLLTSRVGAGLAAEVGSMQITEQIDALRMLGIDPVRFLVVPRFIACVVGGFLLSLIANLVCLSCAMLVSEAKLGYSSGAFITGMRAFVDFQDLIFAGIKGACFGAALTAEPEKAAHQRDNGAEGVGLATTNSVVVASVAIIGLDFVLTYVFSHFY